MNHYLTKAQYSGLYKSLTSSPRCSCAKKTNKIMYIFFVYKDSISRHSRALKNVLCEHNSNFKSGPDCGWVTQTRFSHLIKGTISGKIWKTNTIFQQSVITNCEHVSCHCPFALTGKWARKSILASVNLLFHIFPIYPGGEKSASLLNQVTVLIMGPPRNGIGWFLLLHRGDGVKIHFFAKRVWRRHDQIKDILAIVF